MTGHIYVFAAGNERGGAASHLVTLAKTIREADSRYQYTFVMAGDGSLAERLRAVAGTSVIVLNGGLRSIVRGLRELLSGAPRASLLHAHGPRLNLMAWLATRSIGFPWTSTIHSHIDKDFLASRWKTILLPRVNRMSLRHTVGVFVVNPYFATLIPNKYAVFVPNGLELHNLPKSREEYRRALRERLGISHEAQVIGVAARLDPVKDIATMIKACADPLLQSVHLAIAGDGQQLQYLIDLSKELRVSDRVHFLGFIDSVQEFYAGLDAHVLASLSEGTPFSVLEAGYLGVPNIGSNIPGITQLVRHEETGLCFEVGDSGQLAKQVARVLQDERFASRLVENFRTQILPKYTPLEMLKAYEEGYDKFIYGGDSDL
jgi:glycosyltransferase involved in cell wall biosynthesis